MTFIQPAASHFINGRYVDDTNGPVLELIYPANGQPLKRTLGVQDGYLLLETALLLDDLSALAQPDTFCAGRN